ncbi:TIGR03915 family putative DNA repair protein [Kaistella antarctica]|uniref:DNA metabolism protein n=1 Tax=Kaistella antarctica TaxID=266748 RepID=A0A3S4UMF5_9FLAO|nr:TIGR03915 family putative DNA repair protein [Kaistella antarctica]KEY18701.1 DNA metabolism protein [Kaistella antarctica]SEW16452.1 probable DNA metabolism protein [Kaistella antarctica]VEH99695.1 probable DNA metabolism protein [Kaistella antarctica]
MTTLLYDGTFEGLMTAVFEVYEYRFEPATIIATENYQSESIFTEHHEVITDQQKADRVLKKLEINLGKKGVSQLLRVYLSESEHAERLILSAVSSSIQHPKENILNNFAAIDIMDIAKITKSISREVHRMHAFVRFEKLQDEVYFSKIEPDFNVLPLIVSHFKNRYRDQKWMIYDLKRHYGIFYDLTDVQFFEPALEQTQQLKKTENILHEEEIQYQKLWQRYFFKTNIPERKNLKLHVQSLPKRYWKYLTEKL